MTFLCLYLFIIIAVLSVSAIVYIWASLTEKLDYYEKEEMKNKTKSFCFHFAYYLVFLPVFGVVYFFIALIKKSK